MVTYVSQARPYQKYCTSLYFQSIGALSPMQLKYRKFILLPYSTKYLWESPGHFTVFCKYILVVTFCIHQHLSPDPHLLPCRSLLSLPRWFHPSCSCWPSSSLYGLLTCPWDHWNHSLAGPSCPPLELQWPLEFRRLFLWLLPPVIASVYFESSTSQTILPKNFRDTLQLWFQPQLTSKGMR